MSLRAYLHRSKIAPRLIDMARWCESTKLDLVTEKQAIAILRREWSARAIREAIRRLGHFGIRTVR